MSRVYPLVDIAGGPYERGREYGKKAAPMIKRTLEIYALAFEFNTGRDMEGVRAAAGGFVPVIESYSPPLLEEMRGIADGAGLSLLDVVVINARTELLSSAPLRGASKGECTSMAILPPATSGGDVLLAQTWDWLSLCADTTLLLRVEQPGAPTVLTLAEAGQLAKIGMNEAGFGLCLNILKGHYWRYGVPIHVVIRAMLSSPTIHTATGELYRQPRGASSHFLVAHRDGFAAGYEVMPDDVAFIEPQDGILVHTNHFIEPRMRPFDRYFETGGDSLVRYQRALSLLMGLRGKIDREVIESVLGDHAFYPDGICSHEDPADPDADRGGTLAGIIMEPGGGRMHVASGNPCKSGYRTYSV